MFRSPYFLLIPLLISLSSCDNSFRKADLSEVDTEVQFYNLIDTLETINFEQPNLENQELYQELKGFWRDYTEDILRVGQSTDPMTLKEVERFLSDTIIARIEAAIHDVHDAQLGAYCEELNDGFQRYSYFFPKEVIPEVVFMNSGFNYGIYPTARHLGVGMEFYIGSEHELTKNLDPTVFPGYIRDRMQPEFLTTDALRGWLLVHYQNTYYDNTDLISNCIYWGKMMYLLDILLPDVEDHRKMGYTKEEIEWCRAQERNLWIEFSRQDILYEKRGFEINRWIKEGPFTRAQGIPQDSPDRLGIWIAWQIVRDYMDRNKEVTPSQLLEEKNYLKMLNAYRPN